MSQIATFTEFYNYFLDIATSHVDITGFKFGDKDVIKSSARSNMSTCEMWLQEYEPVSITDNRSDNQIGNIESSITVMMPAPEAWADQRVMIEETEIIIKQIISKMLKDFNDGLLILQMGRFKYGMTEMTFGATKYQGTRLDFIIQRPERLVYDTSKWQ